MADSELMENPERTNGDNVDYVNNDPSRGNLIQPSNPSRPTRRQSLASSVSNEENIEMIALGAARQPELRDQQQNQRHTINDFTMRWSHKFIYLVLSFISLFISMIDLLKRTRNFSAVLDYLNIFLDVVITANSLIILCVVFQFFKRRAEFTNRSVFVCLLCAVCNLLSATIMYYLHHEGMTLVVLITTFILLLLLYVPWLMSRL